MTISLLMEPAGIATAGATAPETGSAVFLHTAWRSGGTWIWSRCRELARVHGYYEPLHEHVAQFRRRDIATMRPESWQSNHSRTAPYFEEYRDLIPPDGRGVTLYDDRFAFDRFFRLPQDPPDPELEAYLRLLLAGHGSAGRVPVVKFCRSLGRVGWLERRFPQVMHAVVLRDPRAQWLSGRRLLERERNRYFTLAPFLVLARNARDPLVVQAAEAFGVRLPDLLSDDMEYCVEATWRHVRRLPPAAQYRGFLAFWTLCAITALDSQALVIDTDRIGASAEHRHTVEAALRERVGDAISLLPRSPTPAPEDREAAPPGAGEAHRVAAALVLAHQRRLVPERQAIILDKLGVGAACVTQIAVKMPAAARSPVARSLARRAQIWCLVQAARAVQPLRRLHGRIASRRRVR